MRDPVARARGLALARLPQHRVVVGGGTLIHVVQAQALTHRTPPDLAGARIAYLRALTLRPDMAAVRNALLRVDQLMADAALMEQDAATILRSDIDDPPANYIMGRLPEAERHARAAVDRDRTFYAGWDTLANILLDDHRAVDAAQASETAVKLHPSDPGLHLTLARVRLAQGKFRDARESLAGHQVRGRSVPDKGIGTRPAPSPMQSTSPIGWLQ